MGSNNNPTVLQFKGAYQRLLAGAFNKTEFGNCQWDDSVHILIQDPSTVNATERVQEAFHLKDIENHKLEVLDNSSLRHLRQNVLVYIAGYIQRRIVDGTDCEHCIKALHHTNLSSSRFLELKDRGGLIRPNKGVVKVVQVVDKLLSEKIKTGDIFAEKHLFKKLAINAQSLIREQFPDVLAELDGHAADKTSHKANILKLIASMYLSMKIKHLAKLRNEDKNSLNRHMNTKMPIHRHE